MDVIVEFNEAAFRHNISKEDILHALKSKIRAGAIEGFPEKYAVIGLALIVPETLLKLCIIQLMMTVSTFSMR